ncbi:response regulator [Sinimarinibacterium flocculans]|uniref:response regulator n=1 Tax=Sinimarinibacterium flocculans TaxID=985250 RepID=UPI00351739A0
MTNHDIPITNLLDAALRAASWCGVGAQWAAAAPASWTIPENDAASVRRSLLRALLSLGPLDIPELFVGARRTSRGLALRLVMRSADARQVRMALDGWRLRSRSSGTLSDIVASRVFDVAVTAGRTESATVARPVPQTAPFTLRRMHRLMPRAGTEGPTGTGNPAPQWPLLSRDWQTTAVARAPRQVLVAEDSAPNRLMLKLMLERMGYTVTCAADGLEAVDACERTAFDAVLMDITMPRMNGLQAVRHLRAHGAANLPVIALSGRSAPEEIAEIDDAGFSDRLLKPVASAQLSLALRRLLGAAA